jgi:hypothetical protein
MANRYLVPLKYLANSSSHSDFKFDDKIKFIEVTYTKVSTLSKKGFMSEGCYDSVAQCEMINEKQKDPRIQGANVMKLFTAVSYAFS